MDRNNCRIFIHITSRVIACRVFREKSRGGVVCSARGSCVICDFHESHFENALYNAVPFTKSGIWLAPNDYMDHTASQPGLWRPLIYFCIFIYFIWRRRLFKRFQRSQTDAKRQYVPAVWI